MSKREILHLAFGQDGCSTTAHWLNLQGLAGTSNDAMCDISLTHQISHENLYVPRAILVDSSCGFRQEDMMHGDSEAMMDRLQVQSVWKGPVAALNALGEEWAPSSSSTQEAPADPFAAFFQTASTLAESSYSRYRVPEAQRSYSSYQTAGNGRHVDWDALEEEEGHAEEDPMIRQQREHHKREEWMTSTLQPLQSQLDSYWEEHDLSTPLATNNLDWRSFFMPPFHHKSCLDVPRSDDNLGYYQVVDASSSLGSWQQDELVERIRWQLEDCDSLQGVVVATSSSSPLFAGLATQSLQYLHDECSSARKLVVSHYRDDDDDDDQVEASQQQQGDESPSWRTQKILAVRRAIERGLCLHDQVELSDVVLPLHLTDWSWQSMARVGAALECASLPYRLSGSRAEANSLVALNAYYFGSYHVGSNFGTAKSLSFSEFLNTLRPSSKHSLLELDMMVPGDESNVDLASQLCEGTSIERDQRMRDTPSMSSVRRPRDSDPGAWMLDQAGVLSSLSSFERDVSARQRSLHHHYALSSSLRLAVGPSMSISQYTTCLMEGQGVRFRPEQSLACVLNQSLHSLVRVGYGAGSYWKHVWKSHAPVLTVLGNTTRSYPLLRRTSREMKEAFTGSFRGFYNRDVMSGVLPESEDCETALAFCRDLQDSYRPPDGSGLYEDENGNDD